MSFSPLFIEKVRDSANIVDVIGQYTELKRSGVRLAGLCPFPDHKEKTPSFSVSEDRQLYHCFGCGKGGNVFTFLQTYRGMTFPDAVEYLAERAGIPIEREKIKGKEVRAKSPQEVDEQKMYFRINKLAAEYYHFLLGKLPENHIHRQYLKKRLLTPEIVENFKIGISPESWDALALVFKKRGVPQELAEKLGLLKKRNKGDGYFDLFRQRLMFPIFSPTGEVLGFGGRTLSDEQPKYLNSPETPVFNKGKTFYGLHETAKYIRSEDQAILVEGYMDLLALYSAGIRNVVAVLGTALTDHHAKILKRYTKNVMLLFDGDAAGQRASERSLSILLAQGLFPKELTLPDGMDPDDFIKNHGAEALKQRMSQAPEAFTAFLERCVKENGGTNAIDKVKTFDRLGPVLKLVADPRLHELYVREAVDRLGVTEEWVRKALANLKSEKIVTETAKPDVQTPPQAPIDAQSQVWSVSQLAKAEVQLIQMALKSVEYMQAIGKSGVEEEMSAEARAILQWISASYRQNPDGFDKLPALLTSKVDQPNFVTMALSSTPVEGDGEKDHKLIQDCVKWVHGRFLRAKAKELATEMTGPVSAEQLEQFMNVQKRKHSLLKEGSAGDSEETER